MEEIDLDNQPSSTASQTVINNTAKKTRNDLVNYYANI